MTLTIYTAPTCQFCRALKDFLHERAITYREYNVVDEPDRFSEMQYITNGVTSVPVIVFNQAQSNQRFFIGFDLNALDAYISTNSSTGTD